MARDQLLRSTFLLQAETCDKLGSPFTGTVCRLLAERLDPETAVGAFVFGWQGDPGPHADSVPLRLCGALNHLAITGRDGGLVDAYPPAGDGEDSEALWQAMDGALRAHEPSIRRFMASAPQTNEVRRSAILLAGWCWLSNHFGMPLVISEVGASAGLNLFAERYRLEGAGFVRGAPGSPVALPVKWHGDMPPDAEIHVQQRAGCDLAPIDATDAAARNRLLAYVWPDQRDRVERTAAAIDVASSRGRTPVERADAAVWLEKRLAAPFDNAVHVIQHTIAWQYFPEAVKRRGETLLAEAGARADANRPLARLSLEADGNTPGAAISLTLWPEGRTVALGRGDYHGRWVDWINPEIA
ncbi:MAG: DUF2332 family protein [Pseudomonadota bacterium]|nr:DUF2332 family protein [Pseudomonadota bacterium]